VTSTTGFVNTVARLLALDAQLDVRNRVQASPNRLLAFSAQPEEIRLVLQTRKGTADLR